MFSKAARNLVFSALIVVMVAGAVLLAPMPGLAAPIAQEGQLAGSPFQIWPGWGYKPWQGTGLDYSLEYSGDKNELVFTVSNNTSKSVTVKNGTDLMSDFALWNGDILVWRAAYGKKLVWQAVTEIFKPGAVKVYRQKLPSLQQGSYVAQAYFLGETKWHPVAAVNLSVKHPVKPVYEPVKYSIEYLASNWFNGTPRLRVTVENISGKDITLPYQFGYQVLVKKVGAAQYLGNVGIGQSLGTLQNGASRFVFVNLNNLQAGSYQADVRSNIGTGSYVTVATVRFSVY